MLHCALKPPADYWPTVGEKISIKPDAAGVAFALCERADGTQSEVIKSMDSLAKGEVAEIGDTGTVTSVVATKTMRGEKIAFVEFEPDV